MNNPALRAIPTHYNGINFRSRLEAKWAAFFDICRFPWHYEAVDLPGAIPDFVLQLPQAMLVECKPAATMQELVPHLMRLHANADAWLGTTKRSQLEAEIRILDTDDRATLLAMWAQRTDWSSLDPDAWCLERIEFLVRELDAMPVRRAIAVGYSPMLVQGADLLTLDGFHAFTMCPGYAVTGRPDAPHVGLLDLRNPGDSRCLVCSGDNPEPEFIPSATMLGEWRNACNATQWKSVR